MKSGNRDIALFLTFFGVVLVAAAWWAGRLDPLFKWVEDFLP
jgi:hypothetical protein